MATDAVGLGMALAAILVADQANGNDQRTYGLYRGEILAALANAVLLFAVAGFVLFEAAKRIDSPHEILTGQMLAVAVVGLVVNIVSWRLLRRGSEESLNVEGAYLEVLADLIGSVAVIVAAVIISITGWTHRRSHHCGRHWALHSSASVAPGPKGPAHPAPSGPRPTSISRSSRPGYAPSQTWWTCMTSTSGP